MLYSKLFLNLIVLSFNSFLKTVRRLFPLQQLIRSRFFYQSYPKLLKGMKTQTGSFNQIKPRFENLIFSLCIYIITFLTKPSKQNKRSYFCLEMKKWSPAFSLCGQFEETVASSRNRHKTRPLCIRTCRAFTLRCYPVFERHGCAFSPLKDPKDLWNFATNSKNHLSRVNCNICDAWLHLLLHIFNSQQRANSTKLLFVLNIIPMVLQSILQSGGKLFSWLRLHWFSSALFPRGHIDCKSSADCSFTLTCAWKTEADIFWVQQFAKHLL